MENMGLKVMVVSFETPSGDEASPFPSCHDRERKLYRYFGMFNAGFWDLWGPRTLLCYLRLLFKGWKILPSHADIHQRGGDVLINPEGRVCFHHIGRGPADRPELERIFRVIEKEKDNGLQTENAKERSLSDSLLCRQAFKADLPGILRLYAQPDIDNGKVLALYEAEHFFERIASYPDYHLYVAVCGEHVIGTFALLIMENLGHLGASSAIIEDVAVDPEWQGRGVGKMMMGYALQKCREKGCYKAVLSSNLKRDKAHTFYESIGFARHGYSFQVDSQPDTESND